MQQVLREWGSQALPFPAPRFPFAGSGSFPYGGVFDKHPATSLRSEDPHPCSPRFPLAGSGSLPFGGVFDKLPEGSGHGTGPPPPGTPISPSRAQGSFPYGGVFD